MHAAAPRLLSKLQQHPCTQTFRHMNANASILKEEKIVFRGVSLLKLE